MAVRALTAVGVFGLLCVPAVFVNNLVGWLPPLAYLLLVALSGAYVLAARASLAVEAAGSAVSCLRGCSVPLAVVLRNRGPLPLVGVRPAFFVTDLFGARETVGTAGLSLAPFETYEAAFDLRFDHLGTYQAGVAQVELRDLVGLFCLRVQVEGARTVEVEPRVYDVSELHLDRRHLKEQPEARTAFSNDGSDYTGVRPYELGDPMKRVHWKLSARTDEYRTRLFETVGEPGVSVVLDFTSPAYAPAQLMDVFDAVVESGLSVGALARGAGMDFDLVYLDRQGELRRVGSQAGWTRRALMDTLPLVRPTDDDADLVRLLQAHMAAPDAHRTLVVCSAHADDELVRELAEVKRRRFNPMLVWVAPPGLEPDERAEKARRLRALDALQVAHIAVSSAADLGRR